MDDKRIDELFRGSAPLDPSVLARATSSVTASLAPVKPLPAPSVLAAALLAIAAAAAVSIAAFLKMDGVRKMSGSAAMLIFLPLIAVAFAGAWLSVSEMIPGSRRILSPRLLVMLAMAAFLASDAISFNDYSLGEFVSQGISCLRAGLITAVPVGLGSWLVLRRGFAVSPLSAAFAAGTFAGIAGVIMLELHCDNFRAPHVMLWHTAVIPVAALAAASVAALRQRRP